MEGVSGMSYMNYFKCKHSGGGDRMAVNLKGIHSEFETWVCPCHREHLVYTRELFTDVDKHIYCDCGRHWKFEFSRTHQAMPELVGVDDNFNNTDKEISE
jgi:hypothetical protein